jgi:hypothetical protein
LLAYLGVCKPSRVATTLAIDDRLLNEARKVGGHKTKTATVTEALTEYIQRRKQQRILDLFGKISIDAAHDHKAQRRPVNVIGDTSVWSLALRRGAPAKRLPNASSPHSFSKGAF